uniref:Carbonic anhydrase or acetyltransferase, isoleucine patch superfamily n=1 Tax=Candidatus Kentrum sp. MB TaxID=2138164 RepID=A0A450XSY6_9GAMM|nr:MAG: Carbonic anhydrase or acetyltransferase, isoleucine patch superfamily [Candidatus Kentron sp. MB]VFK32411.1 MAG: Carbonic anhydrase or acetyltransferase, isoleucine patch superfamily [Candidatus Kentron sp. MB]VFK76192.1 MAG: Carbonic anhydrase or acetyltransferase, isoleucine patch superfamily [Candidatus Kentron sp. MB]
MTIRSFEDKNPRIDPTAYVDEKALVIGDVTIGRDASIWPMTVVRGDVNRITIGERTNIQDLSMIHVTHRGGAQFPDGFETSIANDVTVGHHCVIHGCHIEEFCLIGIGSVVLDGAWIGAHTIIGAGGLVPPGKVLEGGYLWVGQPVRRVRELTEAERENLRYSAEHYSKNKDRYMAAVQDMAVAQDPNQPKKPAPQRRRGLISNRPPR